MESGRGSPAVLPEPPQEALTPARGSVPRLSPVSGPGGVAGPCAWPAGARWSQGARRSPGGLVRGVHASVAASRDADP